MRALDMQFEWAHLLINDYLSALPTGRHKWTWGPAVKIKRAWKNWSIVGTHWSVLPTFCSNLSGIWRILLAIFSPSPLAQSLWLAVKKRKLVKSEHLDRKKVRKQIGQCDGRNLPVGQIFIKGVRNGGASVGSAIRLRNCWDCFQAASVSSGAKLAAFSGQPQRNLWSTAQRY